MYMYKPIFALSLLLAVPTIGAMEHNNNNMTKREYDINNNNYTQKDPSRSSTQKKVDKSEIESKIEKIKNEKKVLKNEKTKIEKDEYKLKMKTIKNKLKKYYLVKKDIETKLIDEKIHDLTELKMLAFFRGDLSKYHNYDKKLREAILLRER